MDLLNRLFVCCLQVTLVASFGLLTSLAARRWLRTSSTLPLAATMVSVLLLSACALSSWPSWLHRPSKPVVSKEDQATPTPVVAGQQMGQSLRDSLEWILKFQETITPSTSPQTVDGTPQAVPSSTLNLSWRHLFAGIMAAGLILGLAQFFGGLSSVSALVRSSRPITDRQLLEEVDLICAELRCVQTIQLRETSRLSTAAIAGWLRPMILLSEKWREWTPAELRSVLAHEIAHITRGDFISTLGAQLGVVLHFYHPLVHCLVNRLRLEQELAADALAARVVGGSRAYLQAIGALALKQTSEPVSWPAHTFLPTRRTFLRRIEMLRDLKNLSGSAPNALRWGTVFCVATMTLVAIGLRPPGDRTSPQALSAQDKPPAVRLPLNAASLEAHGDVIVPDDQYIPADAFIIISAKVPVLNKQFETFKKDKLLPQNMTNPLDQIGPCLLARVVTVLPHETQQVPAPLPRPSIGLCLHYRDQLARDSVLDKLVPSSVQQVWQKKKLLTFEYEVLGTAGLAEINAICRYMPDDQTLIFGTEDVVTKMILAGKKSLSPMTKTESWKSAAASTVAISIDAVGIQRNVAQFPRNPPVLGIFSPMWDSAKSHTLALEVAERTKVTLTSVSFDVAGAQKVEATERAGIDLLTNMLSDRSTRANLGIKAIDALTPILNAHQLSSKGNQTTLTFEADLPAVMSAIASPLAQLHEGAGQAQQQNNLKQIMLALHNYHDVYGHFPPAVVIDPQSKMARSWRVDILPFVDGAALYEQYKKNEPWDSESNRKVLAKMPNVFRHPSQPAESINTSIIAAYGKGLFFEQNATEGTKISKILDGTSNTIAVIESKTEIPWSKPEEITIDVTKDKLPEFGFDAAGFNVGLCDGSARLIPKTIDIGLLKKLLTIAAGDDASEFLETR